MPDIKTLVDDGNTDTWYCDPDHRNRGCGFIARFFRPEHDRRRLHCPHCGKSAPFTQVVER